MTASEITNLVRNSTDSNDADSGNTTDTVDDLPFVNDTETSGLNATSIVINEVELNPRGSDAGREWIELYNPASVEANISGFEISTSFKSATVQLPPDAKIEANGTYVVELDGQMLSNTAESVVLVNASGEVIDKTPSLVDKSDDGRTWQRIPDGNDEWKFAAGTRDELNDPGEQASSTYTARAGSAAGPRDAVRRRGSGPGSAGRVRGGGPRLMRRWRHAALAAAVVALLSACGVASNPMTPLPEPREGRSGLQLSGSFAGRQVAVSDGLPGLLVRECKERHGIPAEVCFASRNIDGALVVVGIANPDAIAAADRLEAARARCATTLGCGENDDHALVFVRVGDDVRQASGGSVAITELVPGSRYAGELRLQVGRERLTGSFDVVPRPEPGGGEPGDQEGGG